MKLKIYTLIFLAFFIFSCNKNQQNVKQEPLSQYITAEEFIGNPKEFAEYSTMFLERFEFYASDAEYLQYIQMVNSELFQKEFIESYRRSKTANPKKFEPDPEALLHKMPFGFYPTTPGYILVTDNPISSGIASGHAGIVYNSRWIIESTPKMGVYRSTDRWDTRYKGYNTWGLKVTSLNDFTHQMAANWAAQQEGKSYNFNYADRRTLARFYCSQLVWRAFYDLGVDLSTNPFAASVFPMDLFNSAQASWIYSSK